MSRWANEKYLRGKMMTHEFEQAPTYSREEMQEIRMRRWKQYRSPKLAALWRQVVNRESREEKRIKKLKEISISIKESGFVDSNAVIQVDKSKGRERL